MQISSTIRSISVILATGLTIFVNALASSIPLNGLTTAEISDRFPILITPAGYVFSIWGVIYTGLIAYSIYQALPDQRANPLFDRIGWLYILSAIANCVWIFLWHYLYIVVAVPIMILLFVSLVYINMELSTERKSSNAVQNWTTHVPFDIYLGWISIAMAANITVALYSEGFRGGIVSESWWAALIIVSISLLSVFMIIIKGNQTYGLVILWSITGILIRYPTNMILIVSCSIAICTHTILIAQKLLYNNTKAHKITTIL